MISAGIRPPAERGDLEWFARRGLKGPIACAAIVLLEILVVLLIITAWEGPIWENVVWFVPMLVAPFWLVDMVRLPRWAWKRARRTKAVWVILAVLTLAFGSGPVVLVFVPVYLFHVRRHVVRQPYGSWPPPKPGTAVALVWPKFPGAWPKFEDQHRPSAPASPDVAEFGDYLNQGSEVAAGGSPRLMTGPPGR